MTACTTTCAVSVMVGFSRRQEALSWSGALDEELRRAATTLALSQIVQRYHVTGFNLVDAPRATRLLRQDCVVGILVLWFLFLLRCCRLCERCRLPTRLVSAIKASGVLYCSNSAWFVSR